MSRSQRTILGFLLATFLMAPWASAAPQAGSAGSGPRAALSRLWSALTSFWSKAGCEIDPNGLCRPATVSPKAGCQADPDGRCLPGSGLSPAPSLDAGCEADPSGRCLGGR